jgi:CRISPR-associated protein Csd2
MTRITNRYDFVILFDVSNGNPNGDPGAGNLPRLDPETSHGLVSDVSLKRKIRNYVEMARGGESGWRIYVQEGAILNERHREAYMAVRNGEPKTESEKKLNPRSDSEMEELRDWMCANFFDVRTFGAVMSTGINCGQVRGPVQLSFGHSLEPIVPVEVTFTRMAATNAREKDARQHTDDEDQRIENRTIGRKYIVPYGLYRAHGFISANLAERTGFSQADLNLLFEALQNMFEHDRSAARGEMATRKLIAFKHDSALGNAHAQDLFERIKIRRRVHGESHELGDITIDNHPPARRFADYDISIDRDGLPSAIEMIEII